MSTLTKPFDISIKPGTEVRIKMAAVKIYQGGAVAIIRGVGYATPLVPATAGMKFIGVAEETVDNSTGSAGDKWIRVRRSGVAPFNQSGLVQADVGSKVWFSDDNTISTTPALVEAGEVVTINEQNGVAEVDFTGAVRASGNIQSYKLTAAGTALTNSTTETSLGSHSIPANTLRVGDIIKIRYQGICTSTNSTDTLAVKLYIGGLSGTALIAEAATDVANNDVFTGEYSLVVRTIGASGTIVGVGTYKSIPAAEGTMTIKDDILASTAIDTTTAQVVSVSGTWSVGSASDSVRLDILNVEIIKA